MHGFYITDYMETDRKRGCTHSVDGLWSLSILTNGRSILIVGLWLMLGQATIRRVWPAPVPFWTVTAPPSTFWPPLVILHGTTAWLLALTVAAFVASLHGSSVTVGSADGVLLLDLAGPK